MVISSDLFDAYLNCPSKWRFRFKNEVATGICILRSTQDVWNSFILVKTGYVWSTCVCPHIMCG